MPSSLTDADIHARIGELGANRYRHIDLLGAIARRAVDGLRVPDGITLGLGEIDQLTRGFRPQDLVLVTGFSHSGKTQLVNTMILNNPDKRILFVSLDDPAEMIVTKLVAMHCKTSAETLETQVRRGDPEAEAHFEQFARAYPNFIVIDKHLRIEKMQEAIDEAIDLWGGHNPHAVIIDYLELVPSVGGDDDMSSVKAKATALQAWAKRNAWPTIVLHQGTRSHAKPGAPITLLSLAFGGEQQATLILGVRRKRDWSELEPEDRLFHENSITIHVVKNKRPGGKLTSWDGIDLFMEPDTGLIRKWAESDKFARTSAAAAARKVAEMPEQQAREAQRALDTQQMGFTEII